MVWLETPTNPTLKLVDIKAVCEIARRKNPKAVIIVDNTFASAFFQVNIIPFFMQFNQQNKVLLIICHK
jgi:cystathionine beta-lyase/cystathionine gamma-synthase